jgi:DUF2075 family protein
MTSSKFEKLPFAKETIEVWGNTDPRNRNWPVVYTIFNDKQIYVGETTNAASRLGQHLGSQTKNGLKDVRVIFDDSFNKSVCLDLESHLIRYFAADEKFNVLNGNGGISDADYFERDRYREAFKTVFDELLESGMLTRSVPEIVNSDLFKYSPFKALNTEQAVAINEILEGLLPVIKKDPGQTFVVQGDPGTGKTIVAVYLMKLLNDIEHATDEDALESNSVFSDFFLEGFKESLHGAKIGLIVPQQSLRKTIKKVFDRTPGLSADQVMKPAEAVKSGEYFDLLIVDEAHRLKQRANQASAMQNTEFAEINQKLFGVDDKSKNQLDWLKAISRHQLLLLDTLQTVQPMDLPPAVTKGFVRTADQSGILYRLRSQMRLVGGEDYIDYVGHVFSGTQPAPKSSFGKYDVKFFESFKDLDQAIRSKNHEHKLARLVAGYGWKWISKGNKDIADFEIEGVPLTWNRTATDWINSKSSSEEVGSIHTVQGYDLNYAGVIVGPELGFDGSTQTIVFYKENYHDAKGKQNNPGKVFTDDELLEFVANIYRVLLTRGILGTYIYVVDPGLRKHLAQYFPHA